MNTQAPGRGELPAERGAGALTSLCVIMLISMAFISEFLYMDCPWCYTKNIAMQKQGNTMTVKNSTGSSREWTLVTCPRCAAAISVETKNNGYTGVIQIVPKSVEDRFFVKHLPTDVGSYYSNAQTALSAGIPSSAAVELRRTLEAASKHQGVEEKTLVKAVQKLVELGLVTKSFESVLSHVRKIGNQGAHATDEQLTEAEVVSAMEFTTQILRNLFEVPEELRLIQVAGTEVEERPVA